MSRKTVVSLAAAAAVACLIGVAPKQAEARAQYNKAFKAMYAQAFVDHSHGIIADTHATGADGVIDRGARHAHVIEQCRVGLAIRAGFHFVNGIFSEGRRFTDLPRDLETGNQCVSVDLIGQKIRSDDRVS